MSTLAEMAEHARQLERENARLREALENVCNQYEKFFTDYLTFSAPGDGLTVECASIKQARALLAEPEAKP